MEQITIPNDIFFENLLDELGTSGHVLLNVKGFSMMPFLRNGKDSVLLAPFDPERGLRRGEVALFRYRNRWIMHRCTGTEVLCHDGRIEKFRRGKDIGDGRAVYVFRGDGNCSGREWAAPGDVHAVAEKRIAPSGKEWSFSSFSWRLCSALWPRTYLVRRLLLGIIRRLPCF